MSKDFSNEANRKADSGKSRYDLIPAGPLESLAQVYTFGAGKYADRGWEAGIKWSRVFAAIMRHLWAFWRGEDRDPESGLPHVIHAAWGCFALAEYSNTKREFNDRPHPDYTMKPTTPEFEAGLTVAGWANKLRPCNAGLTPEWKDAGCLPGKVFVPEALRPPLVQQPG